MEEWDEWNLVKLDILPHHKFTGGFFGIDCSFTRSGTNTCLIAIKQQPEGHVIPLAVVVYSVKLDPASLFVALAERLAVLLMCFCYVTLLDK